MSSRHLQKSGERYDLNRQSRNPAGSMSGRHRQKSGGRCVPRSRPPNREVRASDLNSGTWGAGHSRLGGSERCPFVTHQPGGSGQQSGQNALIQPTEPLQMVHHDPLIDFVDGSVERSQFNDLSAGGCDEPAIGRAATGG